MERLARLHGDRLWKAAWVLCRNEHDARDLVQETLCRALEAEGRFRGESADYTWLYGILRNVYWNQRRKSWRWLPALFARERPAPDEGPLAPLEAEASRVQLGKALARLSFRHREVLLLRYVEEMKIEEIAGCLGLSPGTVKSRLHHAVHRFRKAFRHQNGPILQFTGGEKHAMP